MDRIRYRKSKGYICTSVKVTELTKTISFLISPEINYNNIGEAMCIDIIHIWARSKQPLRLTDSSELFKKTFRFKYKINNTALFVNTHSYTWKTFRVKTIICDVLECSSSKMMEEYKISGITVFKRTTLTH